MIRYATLFCLIAPVFFGVELLWLYDVAAFLSVFLACMFYMLCFELLVGMRHSMININANLNDMWISRIIYIGASILLFKAGYEGVAMFILPWVIINTVTDFMTTLVRFKLIGMEVKGKGDD